MVISCSVSNRLVTPFSSVNVLQSASGISEIPGLRCGQYNYSAFIAFRIISYNGLTSGE